ncbi:MAG: hypothetical protein M1491_08600 [Deltaproteobacteria bacterium]|nr:hypothetical protein [Deltaproteobacteria bacterium]MCL5277231.1 hypothetical protein [Deltaproteobacteria bacterium]
MSTREKRAKKMTTVVALGIGAGQPDPLRTDTSYLATLGFSYLFDLRGAL